LRAIEGPNQFAVISSDRRNRLAAASCTPPLKAFCFREFFYSICRQRRANSCVGREPEFRPGRIYLKISKPGRSRTHDHAQAAATPSTAAFRSFARFSSLMDPALYSPLPDDWSIGVADIVESTRAIAEARYKAVNMAGAAVIAAVTNALEGREFPFVFGGDGASFAVSPDDFAARPRCAGGDRDLGQDDLNLVLRVALVPVTAVRRRAGMSASPGSGRRRICPMRCSPAAGWAWAEAAMKRANSRWRWHHRARSPISPGFRAGSRKFPRCAVLSSRCWWYPGRGAPIPVLSAS